MYVNYFSLKLGKKLSHPLMTLNRQWGLWGESELPGDSPGRNPQAGLRQQPLPQWIIKNTGLQGPRRVPPGPLRKLLDPKQHCG